jgi:hypothetical protein
MNINWLIGNGVDGETGSYLVPPLARDEALALLRREISSPEHIADLRWRAELGDRDVLGPIVGVDPTRLAEAGWGVVFPEGGDPEVERALQPLLEFRRAEAGARFRSLVRRRRETKPVFLARHRQGPGAVDPRRIPYYLLLVGSPEEIPFEFQYHLDVQLAVGRLHFDGPDRYAYYRRYAEAVIQAESGSATPARRVTLFAPKHPGDPATKLTHDHLVRPLGRKLKQHLCASLRPWEIRTVLGKAACRESMLNLLGREDTERSSLSLIACHGLGFPPGPQQRSGQGGLLCQGWKGPGRGLSREHWVGACDISPQAALGGSMFFLFSCYGAGTPAVNDFIHRGPDEPHSLAPAPFVASLPQRLLGHPAGGALAVVGHVDRAWGYSFTWPLAGEQLQAFEGAFQQLLQGAPLGWAMELFSQRYADLAVDVLMEDHTSPESDLLDPLALRTALLDARNFVVLGDPAVRLPAAQN